MNAVSFCARVLWILWLGLALGRGAWAFDGCRAADVNGDGVVDETDVDILLPLLGSPSPRADLDGDDVVGDADVAIVVGFSGTACSTCVADLNDNGIVCGGDRQLLLDAFAFDVDCRPDLNRDGRVDERDAAVFAAYAGGPLSRASRRADFDGDAAVDDDDLSLLEASFGTDCRLDLNRDGAVDARDLVPLHAAWGPCPEPPDGFRGDPEPTCDEGGGSPL